MRRVIAIALVGLGLAGCSSFSLDAFKLTPPTVQVPDSGFSVAYTLNKFQPVTIPVQVINNPGDASAPASTLIDPNPVVAELQPAGPPPKAAARKKVLAPKKPKPPKAAASAPAEAKQAPSR